MSPRVLSHDCLRFLGHSWLLDGGPNVLELPEGLTRQLGAAATAMKRVLLITCESPIVSLVLMLATHRRDDIKVM